MTDVTNKVKAFFQQYRQVHYSKGQVILLNDDAVTSIHYLEQGQVKVYDVTNRGDEMILNVFKAGAFFPMNVVVNHTINPYIYEAETDVDIRLAPADEVIAFIQDNPDVMFDLLSRVYRGMDGLLGRIGHLMTSSAHDRLIYELILEARRFGTMRPNGSCTLAINERNLGARAGLSRETVNRELSKLKNEQLITVQPKYIVLEDLSALEKKIQN